MRKMEMVERIRAIQDRDGYIHGALDMALLLRSQGFGISHNTVAKYMSEHDLHARIRLRKFPDSYYRTVRKLRDFLPRNILDRDFRIGVPSNIYVTDITYVPVRGGWVYLCVMKDLSNNEIVAWCMSAHPDAELCVRTLDDLSGRRDLRGAVIHSDMGSPYLSKAYRARLAELGVTQSMSRKGQCWDNACAETFFAIYKTECFSLDRRELLNHCLEREDVLLRTDRWIETYNLKRRQEKLGWMSPVMYRTLYPNGRLLALPTPEKGVVA